jgi:hypothetical protein
MHSMIADFFMFCEVFFDGYSELCNPEYTRHLCEYGMVFLDGVVLMEFFLLMIRMEFFYSIYMGSFLIWVPWECIDQSIDLSNLGYKVSMKISLIGRWSHKYGSIFKEISPNIVFAHSRVTDIAITDIHRILRKESITYRKGDLLIADHEPWIVPEIMIIEYNYHWDQEKYHRCPYPRIRCEKIGHDSKRKSYCDDQFERLRSRDDPMLMTLVEDFFLKTDICHKGK